MRLLAEAAGTFALVFAGTGALILNDLNGGVVTHLGVSLAFGLSVIAMAYSQVPVSGAHINPAVTLGFLAAGRISPIEFFPYLLSQISGALGASLLLRILFPGHPDLGATRPSGSVFQSFVLEWMMTLILVLAILSLSFGFKKTASFAGLAAGMIVTLEAYWGGPISGASMNPARSLGPALVSSNLQYLWIYLLAPVLGALAAAFFCARIHPVACCGKAGGCSPG